MLNKSAAIVILNWNGYEDTCECIESVLKIDYQNYNIILVDNNSDNNEAERLRFKYKSKIEVVKNNGNLGYAEGNNSALGLIKKDGYDYILILNNDTVVPRNILNELLIPFNDDKVGIVGATIVDYKNRNLIQNRGFVFSLWTGLSFPIDENQPISSNSDKTANVTSGAAFLIKVGLVGDYIFDPDYFCYGEDIDLSHRVLLSGYKIIIQESAHIYHKGSASANKISGFSEHQIIKNRFLLESKHASILQKISFVTINLFLYQPFRIATLIIQGEYCNVKYFITGFYTGLWRSFTSGRAR